MKTAIITLTVTLLFACAHTTNKWKDSLENPKLKKVWESDAVLKDIESAIYDSQNHFIYATSINGHWLEPNGKGYISKLDVKGNVIDESWISGLEGPTGTALVGNKLYVADFDHVVEINTSTKAIINRYKIPNTERINDLCADDDGTIYGTGTKSGQLFGLKDGTVNVYKSDLDWPNGVLCKDGHLIVGLGDKTVVSYDISNETINTIATGISNPDGIIDLDNGDFLISSWEGMIHYVYNDGTKKLLLDTSEDEINAADIAYLPELKLVLVPAMLNNQLIAYELYDEDK